MIARAFNLHELLKLGDVDPFLLEVVELFLNIDLIADLVALTSHRLVTLILLL